MRRLSGVLIHLIVGGLATACYSANDGLENRLIPKPLKLERAEGAFRFGPSSAITIPEGSAPEMARLAGDTNSPI